MSIFLHWAYKAAMEHEAVLGLIVLAFIIAMPPTLPGFLGRSATLQWTWGWLHDGLKTLISLQHPSPGETTVTEARSLKVETGTPATPAVIPTVEEEPK